jgi:hypothetical protein
MKIYSSLPDKIELPDGTVLKPVIGVHREFAMMHIKSKGYKYRNIKVFSRNLKGKEDIHGKPYKPTEWLYCENAQSVRFQYKKAQSEK